MEQLTLEMSLEGSQPNHLRPLLEEGSGVSTPRVSPWRDNASGPSRFLCLPVLLQEMGHAQPSQFGFPLHGSQPVCKTYVSCLFLPCGKRPFSVGEACGCPAVPGMGG